MTSLAFNAAAFDANDNENSSAYPIDNKRNNKTIKRTLNVPNKIENMKKQLVLQSMDSDDSGLADFNPPDKPYSSGVERTKERENDEPVDVEPQESAYMINKGVSSNLDNANYKQQYVENIPYYGRQQESDNKGSFVNKLDYMIHLLEEQREIKTGSATEEVILYSFLGVFIIFVLDSFARAGKYTR